VARLESAAAVWLSLLVGGIIAIAGVGGWAAYRFFQQQPEQLDQPPAAVAPRPASTLEAPPAPALVPRYTARDAERGAADAYRDLWAGIGKNDAEVAIKYVPAAQLRVMKSREQALDSFLGLSPIEDVRVARATTRGEKAVLFVTAGSPSITDASGRRAPIDVVVRMVREDGHWKVERQLWLVSTPPEEQQAEALAWLEGR
jgi:hypothetical protein